MSSFHCFNNLRSPVVRHRRLTAASIFTVALATATLTSLQSQFTALAFSQPHVTAGRPSAASIGGADTFSKSPHFLTLGSGRGEVLQLNGLRNEKALCQSYGSNRELRSSSSALHLQSKPRKYDIDLTALPSDSADEDVSLSEETPTKETSSLKQDLQSIGVLVGAQALLIPISAALAKVLNIPNSGLGLGFEWTSVAAVQGLKWTIPLFVIAAVMQFIEPYSPALQDVTKATQRSVLAVMGKKRRPVFALLVSILLGAVAGWGEEWLFRGVFQTILSEKFSSNIALGISGVVFGLLHAVTPVYALLAGAASVFFGYLYNVSGNLAVPMICHAVYDVGALMWAHWAVTGLTSSEQEDIIQSGPGAPIMDSAMK